MIRIREGTTGRGNRDPASGVQHTAQLYTVIQMTAGELRPIGHAAGPFPACGAELHIEQQA
jgi:hypothetical protein